MIKKAKTLKKNRIYQVQKSIFSIPEKEQMPEENPRDTWMTPSHILGVIKDLTGGDFTIDLACSIKNRVCPVGYTREENSLGQDWSNIKNGWCNPPYSKVGPWVDKACAAQGSQIAMLIPSSTATNWFYNASKNCMSWYFFRGRIEFLPPEGIKASTPRGENALFIFNNRPGADRLGFQGFLPSH